MMGKQTEDVKLAGNGMHRPVAATDNSGDAETREPTNGSALESPEVVSQVEERLANLRGLTSTARGKDSEPEAELKDDPDVEDETGDEETSESKDDATTSDETKDDPDSSPTQEDKEDEHKLPEAYVQCAVAYGWNREEVLDEFKSNPERALKTFSNIYNARNNASARFAALGRESKEQVQTTVEEKPVFKPVNIATLREQYGEELNPLIDVIAEQNKALQQFSEQLPGKEVKAEPKQQPVFKSVADENMVEQQIYDFFEADTMKPYGEVYGKLGIGKTWDDLPPGQKVYRWKVLEMADQIAGGATLKGVDMKMAEALESAHLLVTQKYRDQILIDGIQSKVTERSKGITLKPSKGKHDPGKTLAGTDATKNRTKEEVISSTQEKLNKLFGG